MPSFVVEDDRASIVALGAFSFLTDPVLFISECSS